jgi:murein DD-endopeptidase MepM/ murein hydrolase activator NlpD
MKYLLLSFIALLYLPASGQTNRKPEIERCMEHIYSVREFRQIADSLELSIEELSDYPVIFPVRKPQRISSGFGMRYHPIYKMRKFHTGIDIPKMKGTPVYATGNGVVIRKGYNSGYGYYIEIQHAGGFRSFYAHLSRTIVNIGDSVSITQQIACVGNTGVATGYHLHYEIRKGKRFLNPREWCYLLFRIMKDRFYIQVEKDIQLPEECSK